MIMVDDDSRLSTQNTSMCPSMSGESKRVLRGMVFNEVMILEACGEQYCVQNTMSVVTNVLDGYNQA